MFAWRVMCLDLFANIAFLYIVLHHIRPFPTYSYPMFVLIAIAIGFSMVAEDANS